MAGIKAELSCSTEMGFSVVSSSVCFLTLHRSVPLSSLVTPVYVAMTVFPLLFHVTVVGWVALNRVPSYLWNCPHWNGNAAFGCF